VLLANILVVSLAKNNPHVTPPVRERLQPLYRTRIASTAHNRIFQMLFAAWCLNFTQIC